MKQDELVKTLKEVPDMRCIRCGGEMKPGTALYTETCCFSGRKSPTALVACLKCENCGHSVLPDTETH